MKRVTTHQPTYHEQKLLAVLEEMEGKQYTTLAAALEVYSGREILDIWLRYVGISGYTDSILTVLKTVGYDFGLDDPDYLPIITE